MILHPPAKCRSCGMVGPAFGFAMQNSRSISFKGCTDGPCPNCGGTRDVLDGVYDAVGPVLTLLSGPATTFEVLKRAAMVVRDSREAGESEEKTIERVAEILPSFKKFKGQASKVTVWLALTALTYLGGKFADKVVDPLLKGEDKTQLEIHAMLKDAAEHAQKQRELAAQRAGVQEPSLPGSSSRSRPTQSGTARKGEPIKPQFPKSMAKVEREWNKSHPYKLGQSANKKPEGK